MPSIEHTDEIISMIFDYLNLLRKAGPQERIWREEQKIQEMKFRFRDKEKPSMMITLMILKFFNFAFDLQSATLGD